MKAERVYETPPPPPATMEIVLRMSPRDASVVLRKAKQMDNSPVMASLAEALEAIEVKEQWGS